MGSILELAVHLHIIRYAMTKVSFFFLVVSISRFDDNFKSSHTRQLNKELEQYKDRMSILEAKADNAEEESFKKAQEVRIITRHV